MSKSDQHIHLTYKTIDDKEDQSTQAQTNINHHRQPILTIIKENINHLNIKVHQQQQIYVQLSQNTFSADKILKMISGIIKFLKAFNFPHQSLPVQKLTAEIGQTRRLLRIDRVLLIVKEMNRYWNQAKLSNHDRLMIIFRALLLVEDITDVIVYLIQLKVLNGDVSVLKKRLGNLYFMQCIGWLVYYIYEYRKAQDKDIKDRCRINIIRYCLDLVISHNQTTIKLFSLNAQLLSVLGIISAYLNLSLAWK